MRTHVGWQINAMQWQIKAIKTSPACQAQGFIARDFVQQVFKRLNIPELKAIRPEIPLKTEKKRFDTHKSKKMFNSDNRHIKNVVKHTYPFDAWIVEIVSRFRPQSVYVHKRTSLRWKIKWKKRMFRFFSFLFLFSFPPEIVFALSKFFWYLMTNGKRTGLKLHFVYGSFAVFNITIFCFQIATGWRKFSRRRRFFAEIASFTIYLFVYQFTLLTVFAAFNKTLYRFIIAVYVKHTFATIAACHRDTLLTSSSIQLWSVATYFCRRKVVKQTCDHDEKEKKYEDDIEH